jgi:hypothetical protein
MIYIGNIKKYCYISNRTGPAAEPSGRFPPPLLAGEGMGTPPVYWLQEVGTYIYSHTFTAHGALGHFFEVLRLLMWWESQ